MLSLKDGGNDSIDNVVIACINCNASKKAKDVISWCEDKQIKVPEIVKIMMTNKIKK